MIGDHYVVNKQKSQFVYKALIRTQTLAITNKYLHNNIFALNSDYET